MSAEAVSYTLDRLSLAVRLNVSDKSTERVHVMATATDLRRAWTDQTYWESLSAETKEAAPHPMGSMEDITHNLRKLDASLLQLLSNDCGDHTFACPTSDCTKHSGSADCCFR